MAESPTASLAAVDLHEHDPIGASDSSPAYVDVVALQSSILSSGCSPSNRATSWKLLSGIWPSTRELWPFADDAFIEGEGQTLRLLPAIMPTSPALFPYEVSTPLLSRSLPKAVGAGAVGDHDEQSRPLNEKLLQRVRNKLRRRLAAPINIMTHNLKIDRVSLVDSLLSPAQPLSAKTRDRADSFPGFDAAHSSNYCDEGDGQFLDEIVEDGAAALDADDDDESKSSDSEHEYAQFKPLAPVSGTKLSSRDDACRSAILLLHARVVSVLGRKANRVWYSIIYFMNLPSISLTLSAVLLPSIEAASERDVQLGILQCTELMQHLLVCSLLLVPSVCTLSPLEQIGSDSFSFWPLMNDVSRHLQRRGVSLHHADGSCIGVEQFCVKWFGSLFCCCFEHMDCSILVLDRLVAHCRSNASSSIARSAKQQRSIVSNALLVISVEIAAHVSANPVPHLSTLECLHVLRISEEQLLVLLERAALRLVSI